MDLLIISLESLVGTGEQRRENQGVIQKETHLGIHLAAMVVQTERKREREGDSERERERGRGR